MRGLFTMILTLSSVAAPSPTVTPIVILPGNGYNLASAAWSPQVPEGCFAGVWCDDVVRRTVFAPWGDDAAWARILENLAVLADRCGRAGSPGVCFDGEQYTATKDNNGGRMQSHAWPRGGAERGRQVRAALDGLIVAQYVLVQDALRFPGWREFWGACYLSGDLLLDESGYLPGTERTRAFKDMGVRNLPGREARNGKLRERRPKGDFWVYDSTGHGFETGA